MHSYIGIHTFVPTAKFQSLESLTPLIEQSMNDQKADQKLGSVTVNTFQENIISCMSLYYRLLGITDEVIAGEGKVEPKGILPRYVESLIRYFQNLQENDLNNKEIKILEYSGVTMIKIRYKYTESVIKKLVKLGLKDPSIFQDPLNIFLRGGALHDLIGMQFLCSSPYEKVWVARAMYNFFEYDYRTDDHLVYGFYTVERKSGYRGLHCDHTFFDPRFDVGFSKPCLEECNDKDIFSLYNEEDDDITVLDKYKIFFNIEIQLHTTFENLWSGMEHRNSYNIQAKGTGRSPEIGAQWKLLSDNMQNLAMQFERLQIDTEQARFKSPYRDGYVFIKHIFEEMDSVKTGVYANYREIVKKIDDLEVLFAAREISRQDYVEQLLSEIEFIHRFVETETNPTIQVLFRLVSAFIYYGLANHRQFFNTYDLHQFVKKALYHYKELHTFLSENETIYKGKIINVVIISRILQLSQKNGYGLIDLKDVTMTYSTPPVLSYAEALAYFETGISLLNQLTEEDLKRLQGDNAAYIKMIHRFDILAQEWELSRSEIDSDRGMKIANEIIKFRKKYIKRSLLDQLEMLLQTNKVTNVGFVMRFYSLMVWHGFSEPVTALKQIIKYSAYDKIRTSDIFYYELAAYKFLVLNFCEERQENDEVQEVLPGQLEKVKHYKNYHRNNMIQQLFRIYKEESIYDFHKVRVHFEKLTQTTFKIDHFSDKIRE